MQLTEETARKLLYAIRTLSKSLNAKRQSSWVKVSTIRKLTGWTRERLQRARENGEVQFKKDDKGFWYNPDSINPAHFIISSNQKEVR